MNLPNRKNIRLKGYDYSKAGLYFITICCHNRKHRFGEIEKGKMLLNDIGRIAEEYWIDIPVHYPNVVLHEYIVMPNHFHGIIELKQNNMNKNIDITEKEECDDEISQNDEIDYVRTCHGMSQRNIMGNSVGSSHGITTQINGMTPQINGTVPQTNGMSPQTNGMSPHNFQNIQPSSNLNQFSKPIPGSVSVIINQYKSSVKRWCNKNANENFKWQSRFHDHIIRNEESYIKISDYIIHNPDRWKEDGFFNND